MKSSWFSLTRTLLINPVLRLPAHQREGSVGCQAWRQVLLHAQLLHHCGLRCGREVCTRWVTCVGQWFNKPISWFGSKREQVLTRQSSRSLWERSLRQVCFVRVECGPINPGSWLRTAHQKSRHEAALHLLWARSLRQVGFAPGWVRRSSWIRSTNDALRSLGMWHHFSVCCGTEVRARWVEGVDPWANQGQQLD